MSKAGLWGVRGQKELALACAATRTASISLFPRRDHATVCEVRVNNIRLYTLGNAATVQRFPFVNRIEASE